jgi:hypothetical protein
MRKVLVLGLGMILAAPAFAAKAPAGIGNFRRAEALKAVGAKNDGSSRVRGLSSAAHFASGTRLPTGSRILLVEHVQGGDKIVDIVNAPLNRAESVTKMSARKIRQAGLITQDAALKIADNNRTKGILGARGAITVRKAGLSKRGSYLFIEPGSDGQFTRRTVTVTGSGETAGLR